MGTKKQENNTQRKTTKRSTSKYKNHNEAKKQLEKKHPCTLRAEYTSWLKKGDCRTVAETQKSRRRGFQSRWVLLSPQQWFPSTSHSLSSKVAIVL